MDLPWKIAKTFAFGTSAALTAGLCSGLLSRFPKLTALLAALIVLSLALRLLPSFSYRDASREFAFNQTNQHPPGKRARALKKKRRLKPETHLNHDKM